MTMIHETAAGSLASMTITLKHSLSAAGTLAVLLAAVLSTLVNNLNGVVSAQCVECQLLLSQHTAHQPSGIVIIIIVIISAVCLPLTCLYSDDNT